MARKKPIKKKFEVVFDAKKRREFLTGFQKRKNERRKRAKEDLERKLKEERSRIRQEIKDGVKHMKKSYEPLKELTEADKAQEDEYEDNDVKVKIVELSAADLTSQKNMLGQNFPHEIESNEKEKNLSEVKDVEMSVNCIPGMDFDINSKTKHCPEDANLENGNIAYAHSNKQNCIKNSKIKLEDIKSKKELDHFKKTKTLKKLKKSKAFQIKEHLDKIVNKKNARRNKNNTLRSLPKHLRKNKNFVKSPYNKGRKMNKKQIRKKYEN